MKSVNEGEGIRTLEPTKGQDIHFHKVRFFTEQKLKSCAFDQALLPPHMLKKKTLTLFINIAVKLTKHCVQNPSN